MLEAISKLMNLSEDEILHHPHVLVNVFDQQHKILFWNDQCERYFGISKQEAVGKRMEDLFPAVENNKKMVYLHQALSGLPVYVPDDRFERKEGYYDQVLFPLKDDAGNVVAAVNIVIDITNIKTHHSVKAFVDRLFQ